MNEKLTKKELLEKIKEKGLAGSFDKKTKDELVLIVNSFTQEPEEPKVGEDVKVGEDKKEVNPEITEPEEAEIDAPVVVKKLNYKGIYQRGQYFIAKGQRFETAEEAAKFNSKED